MTLTPVTLSDHAHEVGPFFHGTASRLDPGQELVAGRTSNYHPGRVMNHIYFTSLLETAALAAELAAVLAGEGRQGHVDRVEPTGAFEDDPNVTDKKSPGNPTRSFRSRSALRVVAELRDWPRTEPQRLQDMVRRLARLRAEGTDLIEDDPTATPTPTPTRTATP